MNTLVKVAAGQYTYRGFEIVRATWIRNDPWVIKHELLRGLSYETLKQAVRDIDGWFFDRDTGRRLPDFVTKALDSLSQPSLVRVPAKFFDDHEERECEPFCEPVKRSSRYVSSGCSRPIPASTSCSATRSTTPTSGGLTRSATTAG